MMPPLPAATAGALAACAAAILLLPPPRPLPRAGLVRIAHAFSPNFHLHRGRRSAATWNRRRRPPASSSSSASALRSSSIMDAYECDSAGKDRMDRGALNAAVREFRTACRHHPTAERYLRLGLAYEENGMPRDAIDAYVSARNDSDDASFRGHIALKLAHVWADDLGDVDMALGWSDEAMMFEGDGAGEESADALDRKAVFLAAKGRLDEALELWDKALEREEELGDSVDDARFFRGVARERVGHSEGSASDLASISPDKSYMIDSWKYISSHPPLYDRLFSGTHTHLSDAVAASRTDIPGGGGLVCEFGVFHGKSIRLLAGMLGPDAVLDGFDTFEGIPEAWGAEEKGSYTAGKEIPENVPDNVKFHVGLFADTLPGYVASLPPAEEMPVRLINVDCDLYQGTVEIFQYLAPRIGPGTIILFDEYLMHPTWPQDEYKAFQEACVAYGWKYEYLNYSLVSKQASVRITSSDSFVGPLPPWLTAAAKPASAQA